jgi:protein phosphatase
MVTAFGAKSDIGLKRARNEDCFCADQELGLYIVCDGMGGRKGGDVASRMAVEAIQTHVREGRDVSLPMIGEPDRRFSTPTNRLASALRFANQVIHRAARTHPGQEGMGTTVVAALLEGAVLSVAHVGDSRMYLIREQAIRTLTADHALVTEQVRLGLLTEEQARLSPMRGVLTRAVGLEEAVEVELDEVPLMPGDSLVLCSDGLTRAVTPPEVLETVLRVPEPQAASERLVDLANAAGGEDNTTVILIRLGNG